MKKNLFFACLFSVVVLFGAFAQDEEEGPQVKEKEKSEKKEESERSKRWRKGEVKTLSGNNYHSGGFGAIAFKGTDYLGQTMVMGGLRGGWIINRSVALGFEGWGIIPTVRLQNVYPFSDVIVLGGYGGFFIEPIFFSNEIVHFTLPIAGGAGWMGYQESSANYDYYGNLVADDVYWYVEPGIALELNVSRHFRMDFGVSKRFMQDFEMLNTSSSAFEQLNYFLTLKFGGF